jgi:hypothetical protein
MEAAVPITTVLISHPQFDMVSRIAVPALTDPPGDMIQSVISSSLKDAR